MKKTIGAAAVAACGFCGFAANFIFFCLVLMSALCAGAQDEKCPVNPNVRGHENTEWSTSYSFHLTDKYRNLPRVLLIGDSICNGYVSGVAKRLEGTVNVSYWISSYCASMPGYGRLLSFQLDEARYDVIHFNNGLHSLSTPAGTYAKGVEAALRLIREKQPKAKIVWATSTPLRTPANTDKVRALNAAVAPLAARLCDATNDLFALDDPFARAEFWSDEFHHKPALRERESDRVADSIRAALAGTE